MKKIFNLKNKLPYECGFTNSIIIMAILSLLLVLMQCITQSGAAGSGILSLLAMPLLPLANALPIFCVMLIAYAITNRVWAGFLSAALPLYILLTVNYFKVYFRSETLSIHDFSLFSEATDIMTGYEFPVPFSLIISALIAAAVFVVLFKFIKSRKTSSKKRIILIAASAVAAVGGYFGLYGNQTVYDALPSFANQYNDVSIAAHKGFLFTFLSHTSGYEYKLPRGYDIHSVPQIGDSEPDEVSEIAEPVNVIAVMSEAFFDMEACENVEFYDGMSPTPNFDRLKSDSLWGHILVPGYAGSTASTEFEFLTGINISRLDSSMPVVYKTHVTKSTYGLPQYFSDLGYTTEAFHPGHAWFYNRKAVYPRLGFENTYFKEDFEYTRADLVNYYVSDKITADRIIGEYGDYINSGNNNGYFSFTVTIQNHGPYSTAEPEIKRIIRHDGIDDEMYNRLCNYANGLHDADELLGRVCDYADTVDVPTVVVFFGDHLPYFDSEGEALTWLGLDVNSDTPQAMENRYSTPYIIHGNDAFNTLSGGTKNGNIEHISSSYLSSALIDYMGFDAPPYFNAIGEIKKHIQEISTSFYIADGVHTPTLTPEQEQLLTYYDYLSYWALRDYR